MFQIKHHCSDDDPIPTPINQSIMRQQFKPSLQNLCNKSYYNTQIIAITAAWLSFAADKLFSNFYFLYLKLHYYAKNNMLAFVLGQEYMF